MYYCNRHNQEITHFCMKLGCNATIPSCQYCALGGDNIHDQDHGIADFITLTKLKEKAEFNQNYIRLFKKILEELITKIKYSIDQIEHQLKQLNFHKRLGQCSFQDLSDIAYNLRYPDENLYQAAQKQYNEISINIDQQFNSLVQTTNSLLKKQIQYQLSKQFPQNHYNSIIAIATSPKNKYVASGGEGGEIMLWGAQQNQFLKQFNGEQSIGCLKFSPKEDFLAAGQISHPFEILIFDVNLPQQDYRYKLRGVHTNKITRLCFSMEQQYLISASFDNQLITWNFLNATLHNKNNLQDQITGLSIKEYSKVLAVSTLENGKIFIFEKDDNFQYELSIIAHWQAHEKCHCVEFISGSNLIVSGGNTSIRIWDSKNIIQQMKYNIKQKLNVIPTVHLTQVKNIWSIVVSDNGQYLIYLDDYIYIWDIREKKNIQKLYQQDQLFKNNIMQKQLVITNDLKYIFIADQNKRINIYENKMQQY